MTLGRLGAVDFIPSRFGLREPVGEHDSIGGRLASVVGRPVTLGVHLGPPRANRKPIVQVMDRRGRTMAFAKVGTTDLTRTLVRAERAALQQLSAVGFTTLCLPDLLYAGSWQGNELLVLSPVRTSNDAHPRPMLLSQAMVELSTALGRARRALITSAYWRDLHARLARINGPVAAALLVCMRDLNDVSERSVDFGSWHGDWTPWNMALTGDRVVVWDWERFQVGVPLGLDALHFEMRSAIRRRHVEPRLAVRSMAAHAGELLAPFGVRRSSVSLVVASYLIEVGVRSLDDRQHEAGARLGDLGSWLVPELSLLVSEAVGQRRP